MRELLRHPALCCETFLEDGYDVILEIDNQGAPSSQKTLSGGVLFLWPLLQYRPFPTDSTNGELNQGSYSRTIGQGRTGNELS